MHEMVYSWVISPCLPVATSALLPHHNQVSGFGRVQQSPAFRLIGTSLLLFGGSAPPVLCGIPNQQHAAMQAPLPDHKTELKKLIAQARSRSVCRRWVLPRESSLPGPPLN